MAVPDMVGHVVKDMAATLAFYRLLGLEIPEPEPGSPHVEVVINGYRLAWDAEAMIKELYPEWQLTDGGGRVSVAFRCDSPADVDAVHARVVAAGHQSDTAPWDAFWGQRYAVVRDPDGNSVDLFCPLS